MLYRSKFYFIFIISTAFSFLFIYFKNQPELGLATFEFIGYLPPAVTAHAIVKLAEVDYYWILYAGLILVYSTVLFMFLYFLLAVRLKVSNSMPAGQKCWRQKSSLTFINDRMPILLLKEIVYLIRSYRVKIMLLIGVLFSVLYLHGRIFRSSDFSYLNLILLGVGPLYLAFESISAWLHEGEASKFYFYATIDFKKLIIAKNLAFFFWILVVNAINVGVGFLLKPDYMVWQNIAYSFVFMTAFYWFMVIVLNYFAFNWPKKVAFDTIFSKSMTASSTSIIMVPTIVLFILLYLPFLFDPSVTKLLLIIITLTSFFIYYISLDFIWCHAVENKEIFIETVS